MIISLAAAIKGRRAGGVILVCSMTMAMVFSCFFRRIMMMTITFVMMLLIMVMLMFIFFSMQALIVQALIIQAVAMVMVTTVVVLFDDHLIAFKQANTEDQRQRNFALNRTEDTGVGFNCAQLPLQGLNSGLLNQIALIK